MSLALLIARLVLGLGIAAHGAQKLFGWFGGHGLRNTGEFFVQQLHFPARTFALLAGLGEFGGGLLIALGFLGPVGPALVIVVMIVAILTVHVPNGFFATNNGVELPLIYATGALVLAFTGPGLLSLDRVVGLLWLSAPRYAWIAVAVGVVLGVANAMASRLAPSKARAS